VFRYCRGTAVTVIRIREIYNNIIKRESNHNTGKTAAWTGEIE
jgi:hypothetical protein